MKELCAIIGIELFQLYANYNLNEMLPYRYLRNDKDR